MNKILSTHVGSLPRKKDLLQLLSQKSTKEEHDFLRKLISFMERRNTPIERPPMLGFKQSKYISW